MPSYLPDVAVEFRDLYARVEYVLRRSRYSRKDRKKAEVNWAKFAMEMDEPFFLYVREQKRADTLIKEPPRAYYRNEGWQPVQQQPIADVEELFVLGVCQVRHNIFHGEKFMMEEGQRSYNLVNEAHWVLAEAIKKHRDSAKLFGAFQSAK